ncbi:hypothetical protein [Nocardioides sp. zg-DK7169]|uniref:hypothetical protein n=1 Tax=Nocardioides sp. zg-DK7169 TaxID=2736600 RepID=UPI001555D85A|nr:hypothetical protein [Nocardioides sp. zg-DK7169]NPC96857.1 hypothetical protein [Nocardioides sp. zg-DK7169]
MFQRATLTPFAVLLLALTLVAGCASDPADSSQADAPVPASPDTIEELQDMVMDAGLACDSLWKKPMLQRRDTETRFCDDAASLASFDLYTSEERTQAAILEKAELAEKWRAIGTSDIVPSLLVGPNWAVEGAAEQLRALVPIIGGDLQENTCEAVPEDPTACDPDADVDLPDPAVAEEDFLRAMRDVLAPVTVSHAMAAALVDVGEAICESKDAFTSTAGQLHDILVPEFGEQHSEELLLTAVGVLCPFEDRELAATWLGI